MGLPASQAEGEEAGLMKPARMAMATPLRRSKSLLAGLGLFFEGELLVLGDAGGAVDGDAEDADGHAEEDDLAGGGVEDFAELAVVDGRDDGAEGGAEAERDGVSEGDAEVADGEAEGDAADSPENAAEERVVNGGGVSGVDLVEDAEEIGDEEGAEDERSDDPGGEALDEPVDLPRPALDAAEGDEVGGGGEAADPVEDDAEKRIWTHALPRSERTRNCSGGVHHT